MVDQKSLSARAQRYIQRLYLGNRCMSAASIAAEVEGVWGGQPVSTQTIRRTLHQIEMMTYSKDEAQESQQTVFWRQAD